MRQAVIDVGSNTIRTVVYEIDGKNYKTLLNERDFSSIISYIENEALSDEGVTKLKEVLTKMVTLCRLLECVKIHCFATASLRNVSNSEKVLSDIKKELDLDVEIIAGTDEAKYDFAGLKSAVDVKDGVGLDLGGGSCQVFSFENGKLNDCQSFPIGCLKLYDKFVEGIMPTPTEAKAIKAYVTECLKNAPELKKLGFDTVYAMGGSARAAAKLHRAFVGSEKPISGYELTINKMDELCGLIDDMNLSGVRLIAKILPERVNTIVTGILALRTVCKYVGADKIQIVKAGVREGFLYENLLK